MNDTETPKSQPPVEAGPPPKTVTEQRIEWLEEEISERQAHIQWLRDHATVLDAIGIAPSRFGGFIDFNQPTRDKILAIIKAFPGRWNKELNDYTSDKKMDYVRERQQDGMTLRIWAGELPPCCKLVEEWVDVPAAPATRVLRKVVKCPEPMPAVEAEVTL